MKPPYQATNDHLPAKALHSLDHAERERLFRRLVAEHGKRLHRMIIRRIGHFDEAEDIAQQAFCEAARTLDSFRGDSQLSTWLYGIAMNLVRNYLSRAPYRTCRFEPEDVLEVHPSEDGNPEALLNVREYLSQVTDAMNELPAEMREVLLLVGVEGLSYELAAIRLAVPIGTVRSRLSRARTALRLKVATRDAAESTAPQLRINALETYPAERATEFRPSY